MCLYALKVWSAVEIDWLPLTGAACLLASIVRISYCLQPLVLIALAIGLN